jgi:tRNA threonylcarbamoyladenosine biosynthesis protein TsaE
MTPFVSQSIEETRRLGEIIGRHVQPGTVVALDGTLGAGKTHLTQGIGLGLDVPAGNVVSPTFTICIPYAGRLPLMHLDAYRIKSPEEVDQLGLDESIDDGVVLVVEWASRIEPLLPPIDVSVQIEQTGDGERVFKMTANSEMGEALVAKIGEEY